MSKFDHEKRNTHSPLTTRHSPLITHSDPCVLFALRRESAAFRREFRPYQRFRDAPFPASFCGPAWLSVLVVEIGVGSTRMGKALDWLLKKPLLDSVPYQPKLVLMAGFCGALHPERQVGDIILANEIIDTDHNSHPVTWPESLPGRAWYPVLHRGRVLTVAKLVAKPEDKQQLAKEYDAVAVDMESAIVAKRCREAGIPFGCVRAVSDDSRTALSPQLVSLLSGGRASFLRTLSAMFRRPSLIAEMWRLGRKTRIAAQRLAQALGELLTLTLPDSEDL